MTVTRNCIHCGHPPTVYGGHLHMPDGTAIVAGRCDGCRDVRDCRYGEVKDCVCWSACCGVWQERHGVTTMDSADAEHLAAWKIFGDG